MAPRRAVHVGPIQSIIRRRRCCEAAVSGGHRQNRECFHELSFVCFASGYLWYIVLQVCEPSWSGEYRINFIYEICICLLILSSFSHQYQISSYIDSDVNIISNILSLFCIQTNKQTTNSWYQLTSFLSIPCSGKPLTASQCATSLTKRSFFI